MVLLPLDELVKAAVLLSPLVIVLVEMAKAAGLTGSRRKAWAAIMAGQALTWAHWAVAWQQTPATGYSAFLCGLVASAIAMGLWARALKQIVERKVS